MMKIKSIISPKVTLSDIASPKPSRAAARVLSGAIKRAYVDQKIVSRQAHSIRTN